MSRIGKLPIKVPKNVNITLDGTKIEVKGPNGTLNREIPSIIGVSLEEDTLTVNKKEETRLARQQYGLVRSLLNNMVLGVSNKFEKKTSNDWSGLSSSSPRKRIDIKRWV